MDLGIDLDKVLGPRGGTTQAPIRNLRTTHHELARLLALGLKDVEISRLTGYSQSWISLLKRNPLFDELVQHYMANRDAAAADMSGRLRQLGMTSVEVMQERLLDDPDSLTMTDLRKVAELGLDRTGYGPTSTQKVVSFDLKSLDEIKSLIEKEHRGRVLPRDQELEAGQGGGDSPGEDPAAEASQGLEGPGSEVREAGETLDLQPLAGGPA